MNVDSKKYSHNVIINMGGEAYQTDALKQRMRNQNYLEGDITVINLQAEDLSKDVTEEDLKLFAKVDSNARIFIMDHGLPNSPKIGGKHFSDVSDYLAARLQTDQLNGTDRHLRINLIPCFSVKGANESANSFAARFHHHLAEAHGIKAEVTGRTRIVMLGSLTPQYGILTTTANDYFNRIRKMFERGCSVSQVFPQPDVYRHAPGTKYTFKWEQNSQVMVDSYIESFSRRVAVLTKNLEDKVEKDKFLALEEHVNNIHSLIENSSTLNFSTAKKIRNELKHIKKHLSLSEDDSFIKEIDVLLKKSKKEISSESAAAHPLGRIFNPESSKAYESFNSQIKRRIFDEGIAALRQMPKTEQEKPIKKAVSEGLQYIADVAATKLRDDTTIDLEDLLAKSMTAIINTLNTQGERKVKRGMIGHIKGAARDLIRNFYRNETEHPVAQQYEASLNAIVRSSFEYLDQY